MNDTEKLYSILNSMLKTLERQGIYLGDIDLENIVEAAAMEIPVQYILRPEENEIRLQMDMRFPFQNKIRYGRDGRQSFVDVLETYAYFKGLAIHRRIRFDFGEWLYRVIRSDDRIVIFRDILEGDDTENILEILKDTRIAGPQRLDINHKANFPQIDRHTDISEIYLITALDFDTMPFLEPAGEVSNLAD